MAFPRGYAGQLAPALCNTVPRQRAPGPRTAAKPVLKQGTQRAELTGSKSPHGAFFGSASLSSLTPTTFMNASGTSTPPKRVVTAAVRNPSWRNERNPSCKNLGEASFPGKSAEPPKMGPRKTFTRAGGLVPLVPATSQHGVQASVMRPRKLTHGRSKGGKRGEYTEAGPRRPAQRVKMLGSGAPWSLEWRDFNSPPER